MVNQTITATFANRDQADAALGHLRRAGAVCCTCSLPVFQPAGRAAGNATLHLMVRGTDAPLARDIIRLAGGRL